MLKKIKSYLNTGFNFYGIEIFDVEEKTYFQVSHIQEKKKELFVVSESKYTTLDELLLTLDTKIPVCLTYNTKNVLDRLIEKKQDLNIQSTIEYTFPNLDITRFYFNIALFENENYLAIVEKKTITALIQKFTKKQIQIANLHIGIAPLAHIKPYLNNTQIISNNKKLNFNKDTPSSITKVISSKDATTYSINGLDIKSESLINFSSVLRYLIPQENIKTNYSDLAKTISDSTKFSRRFQALLWPIVSLFLGLLLLNFLIFSYYYDKLEILNQDSSINSSNKERLVKLKETVSSKETRVETILGNKNTKSTLYLDEIANSVPNTMLLDAITYQPLLKPVQKNKPIEQNLNTIIIKGESYNSDNFSSWTDTLEGFKWTKAVETLGYGYKTQKSSYFTIKLLVDGE